MTKGQLRVSYDLLFCGGLLRSKNEERSKNNFLSDVRCLQPEDLESEMRANSRGAWRGLLMRQKLKTAFKTVNVVGETFFLQVILASNVFAAFLSCRKITAAEIKRLWACVSSSPYMDGWMNGCVYMH